MTRSDPARGGTWKWWVCGLLLCASTINYMDRQTLANAATRITIQFHLTQEQYGNLELVFGWAFAAGSLGFGFVVDRWPVRWVYPSALLLWSATGFATGLVRGYDGLLVCRALLGLFEGGHWPCAVKTTQFLLAPADRSMGNSLLQSGTSIGAILTPLIMQAMLTEELGSWRPAFQWIGALGLFWVAAW
ncbi:MAG TPA: MFS transporter, partial [Methylomirabilota bacterium]|nr:MFS transporter [Methylomirabilota bacterium]